MVFIQTAELRFEIERVSLLYQQNLQGVQALAIFAATYSYFCRDLMAPLLFSFWLTLVVSSIIIRVFSTYAWKKKQSSLRSLSEVARWYQFIQVLIFSSGVIWGIAGWIGARSPTAIQQIVTAITVICMSAGALVCWAPARRSLFLFIVPAMIPWSVSYLSKADFPSQILGLSALVYIFIGSRAGLLLNRYFEDSIRLNIENLQLTKDLELEILIKDRAEESLRLALTSSAAMEWRWDVDKDIFICNGELIHSLGINSTQYSGTIEQMAQLLSKQDQERFRALFLGLALKGGELEADFKIIWPTNDQHNLTFRGKSNAKGKKDSVNKIYTLTGIAWDTTAQKQQEKIKQERDIHEAANQAKSVFLANASHEIRTPLAVINGYVENLLQEHLQDSELRSDLQTIERNGKFLNSLVNDFLDLAKIESGQYYIQKAFLSLKTEIDESLDLIRPLLQKKGLSLNVIYETAVPAKIETDQTRFRQIFTNLLSNAVKFTESGSVTIRIWHTSTPDDGGRLNVRVVDTGLGIDKATQTNLFEPFLRGQHVSIQKIQGAGLGLALSRTLARLLGGDLKLLQSTMGLGSEFELSIKTGPMYSPSHSLTTVASPVIESNPRVLSDLKILVVDDASELRLFMRRLLEKKGAKVYTSENGQQAVERTLHEDFDLLLMDIKMPVMDGYEATRILRSRGFKKPIIAVTAHASEEDKQKTLKAGCNYYLSKPVSSKVLLEAISHAVLVGT